VIDSLLKAEGRSSDRNVESYKLYKKVRGCGTSENDIAST